MELDPIGPLHLILVRRKGMRFAAMSHLPDKINTDSRLSPKRLNGIANEHNPTQRAGLQYEVNALEIKNIQVQNVL